MRKFHWIALGIVTAASVLGLSACGGGGGTSNTAKTSTAAASTGAVSTSPVGASTPGSTRASGTAAATASGGGNGGNSDDVKAAARKFADSTFKGTYKVSGSGSDLFTNGQLIIEKQGKDKFRFDLTSTQNGKEGAIIFIETPGTTAFCLKDAGDFGASFGVDTGQGVCFKSDPSDKNNPLGGISQSLTDLENSNVTVLDTSTKTVAGKDGKCYKTKDNDTSEVTTTCFTNDGVILYAETEGDNASTIEAQSISKDVNGDDFNLPYEVRDLPKFGAGDGTVTAGDATP